MTQLEAVEAVRDYLTHSGGSETKQIWLGLEKAVTLAQVNKAVKALACRIIVIGDWPKYTSNGDRIPRTVSTSRSRYSIPLPNFCDKFTVYALPNN